MIIQEQMKVSTELVDGNEVQKETSLEVKIYDIYKEVEKVGLDDKKVIIKELVGSYTKAEIEADIANLANQIADLENQKRDKEAILAEFNK
jgi:hypothetical protein